MNHFRKTLPIMITTIALSGCAGQKYKTPVLDKAASIPLSKTLLQTGKNFSPARVYKNTAHLTQNKYLLDQDRSLEVAISEYGYTRVSLEDERITDVFVYPQEDIQVRIHQQGYLIMAPKLPQENIEEEEKPVDNKIYVTITGEHGTTQDFSLRLMGRPPAPVKFIKLKLEQRNESNRG